MKDSSPAKGTPTSVFSCEPSAGDFSFVSPERIQASDEGVSDFDTLTFHSEDWSEMDPLTKEYLQDYDDSSSMDDSTYMSQPDTTGQVPVSGPSGQYGYVDQNPFFEQYMRYSPSQGSDSHGSRQGSQPRPSIVMQSPLIDSPSLADPGLTYTNFSQNSAGAGRPSNFDFQSSQQLSLSGARSLGQGSDVEGRVEDTWTPPEPQSYNNPFMNVEAGWGQFRPQGEYIPEDVGVQLRQPHPLSLRYQQQGGAGSVPVRTQSYPGPQPGQAMMSQDVMRRSSAAVPHGSIDPSTIVSPTGSAIHDSHETVGIFDLADNRHSFISIPR
ncbi:hypothetical protein BDY21DRAFT_9837 [Lineolata rhizophorae]|uniref:Uncharacterized protein n=1 Tax=Lineolata rhizophorae TaxID=578093 RepID=A0A6A6PEH4_9PEZI|nr:hypothetical protein BDY21DRAFT_9837 [Lineolata rhizophorae]